MVRACDAKRGALCRMEGSGKGSAREKEDRWLDTVRDDIKEKGLSADDVYDHATWRHTSSYIDVTKKWV